MCLWVCVACEVSEACKLCMWIKCMKLVNHVKCACAACEVCAANGSLEAVASPIQRMSCPPPFSWSFAVCMYVCAEQESKHSYIMYHTIKSLSLSPPPPPPPPKSEQDSVWNSDRCHLWDENTDIHSPYDDLVHHGVVRSRGSVWEVRCVCYSRTPGKMESIVHVHVRTTILIFNIFPHPTMEKSSHHMYHTLYTYTYITVHLLSATVTVHPRYKCTVDSMCLHTHTHTVVQGSKGMKSKPIHNIQP